MAYLLSFEVKKYNLRGTQINTVKNLQEGEMISTVVTTDIKPRPKSAVHLFQLCAGWGTDLGLCSPN